MSSWTTTTRPVLPRRRLDGGPVDRVHRAEVDDLHVDADEPIGHLDATAQHPAVGDDGDVGAAAGRRPPPPAGPRRHAGSGRRARSGRAPCARSRGPGWDRPPPRGAGRRRPARCPGHTTFSPGTWAKIALGALGVERTGADARARGRSHDEGHGDPEAVVQLRRFGDQLVVRARHEVGELQLDDRAPARDRQTDPRADDGRLRHRGVEHPVGAEALEEVPR